MGLLRRRRRQLIWSAKSSRYSVKWTDDGPVNTGLEQQELVIRAKSVLKTGKTGQTGKSHKRSDTNREVSQTK